MTFMTVHERDDSYWPLMMTFLYTNEKKPTPINYNYWNAVLKLSAQN